MRLSENLPMPSVKAGTEKPSGKAGKRPFVRKAVERKEIPSFCPYCENEHIIRFGHLRNGLQRYRCRGCSKTFSPDAKGKQYRLERRRFLLAAYFIHGSIRAVARLYGVSRNTLSYWLKQEEQKPD
jgi:transposase-like protein